MELVTPLILVPAHVPLAKGSSAVTILLQQLGPGGRVGGQTHSACCVDQHRRGVEGLGYAKPPSVPSYTMYYTLHNLSTIMCTYYVYIPHPCLYLPVRAETLLGVHIE